MAPIVTQEAAMSIMTARQTALAMSTLHLCQDTIGTISKNTTKAQLAAAVATFTGYVAKTIAAFLAPYFDPAGGVSMQAPTQQFDCTGAVATNMIRAWWLEDAAGDVQAVGQFDSDIAMADAGNSIPIDVKFNQPN